MLSDADMIEFSVTPQRDGLGRVDRSRMVIVGRLGRRVVCRAELHVVEPGADHAGRAHLSRVTFTTDGAVWGAAQALAAEAMVVARRRGATEIAVVVEPDRFEDRRSYGALGFVDDGAVMTRALN